MAEGDHNPRVKVFFDGQFAVRMCNHETMQDFDAYARAAAAIGRSRDQLLEEE